MKSFCVLSASLGVEEVGFSPTVGAGVILEPELQSKRFEVISGGVQSESEAAVDLDFAFPLFRVVFDGEALDGRMVGRGRG